MSKCFGRSRVGRSLEEDGLFFARSLSQLSGNSKGHVLRSPGAWLDRNRVSSGTKPHSF
ncbi:hypothetical protein QUB52_00155 [Microcoleus sp. A6-C6]